MKISRCINGLARGFRQIVKPRFYAENSTASFSTSQNTPMSDYKLVIFDKDGTLIKFGSGYSEWVLHQTKIIEDETGLHIGNGLLQLLGYDVSARKWREGLMCDEPDAIIAGISRYLQDQGLSKVDALHVAEKSFIYDHTIDRSLIIPIDNPTAIFQTVKHYGLHRAICTADSAYYTKLAVEKFHLHGLCEFTFSGDDKGFVNKPRPENVLHICRTFGVEPKATVMIGDTLRDMKMGQNAGVGLTIGVTSGVCEEEELQGNCDVLVPSIAESLQYYLPSDCMKTYEEYWKKSVS